MSRTRHLKLSLALLLCSDDASYLSQKLSLLKHVHGLTLRTKEFCGNEDNQEVKGQDAPGTADNVTTEKTDSPSSTPKKLTYKIIDNSNYWSWTLGFSYLKGVTNRWGIELLDSGDSDIPSDFLMCPDRVADFMVKIFDAVEDLIKALDFKKVPKASVKSFSLADYLVLHAEYTFRKEVPEILQSMYDLNSVFINNLNDNLVAAMETLDLPQEYTEPNEVAESADLIESDLPFTDSEEFKKIVLPQALAIVRALKEYGASECKRVCLDRLSKESFSDYERQFGEIENLSNKSLLDYERRFGDIEQLLISKDPPTYEREMCNWVNKFDLDGFNKPHCRWRKETISATCLDSTSLGTGGKIDKILQKWEEEKTKCTFGLFCTGCRCLPEILGTGKCGDVYGCSEASFKFEDIIDTSQTRRRNDLEFYHKSHNLCVVKFFRAGVVRNTKEEIFHELVMTQARGHENLVKECDLVKKNAVEGVPIQEMDQYLPQALVFEYVRYTLEESWNSFAHNLALTSSYSEKQQNLIREKRASEVGAQIIAGLCALHEPQLQQYYDSDSGEPKTNMVIIHRDLHRGNIGIKKELSIDHSKPIDSGTVKILDFGRAEEFEYTSDGSKMIKPLYGKPITPWEKLRRKAIAPEMSESDAAQTQSKGYFTPADIYMVAVILFDLLCSQQIRAKFPYLKETIPVLPGCDYASEIYNDIYDSDPEDLEYNKAIIKKLKKKSEAQWTYEKWIDECVSSDEGKAIIKDMLNPDQFKRPSAQQCSERVKAWLDEISSKVEVECAEKSSQVAVVAGPESQ